MMQGSPWEAKQVASDLAQKGQSNLGAAPKYLVLFCLAFLTVELDVFLPLNAELPK